MFQSCRDVIRAPITDRKSSSAASSCLNAHKCEFCDKGWQSETELYYHKRVHYKYVRKKIKEGDHFCWTCLRKYESEGALIGHYKRRHLLSSDDSQRVQHNIFACDECSHLFFEKKMLAIHIESVHRKHFKMQPLECPICHKNISSNTWNHFLAHDVIGLHTCPICFKKCMNRSELKNHTKKHRSFFYCDICSENFGTMKIYTDHIKKHKTEQERLSDEDEEDTDKYFIPKQTTNPYVVTYQKLLPYQGLRLPNKMKICILCREICTSFKERKQHIKHHKTFRYEMPQNIYEQNKYVCGCGKIFLHKILLKQHLLKNNGSEVHQELNPADYEAIFSNSEEYAVLEIVDVEELNTEPISYIVSKP